MACEGLRKALKSSALGLMLCCRCLNILNSFSAKKSCILILYWTPQIEEPVLRPGRDGVVLGRAGLGN